MALEIALSGALETTRTAFVPDDLSKPFAAYVQRTLRPALDRFGIDKRSGESEDVSLLRPTLVEWLGKYGMDQDVLAQRRVRHFAGISCGVV